MDVTAALNNPNPMLKDISHFIATYASRNPLKEKFSNTWTKTEAELLQGDNQIYKAFIEECPGKLWQVRNYFKFTSPYYISRHKPNGYLAGERISFGYGYAARYSEHLTQALIVFMKNYYGEDRYKKEITKLYEYSKPYYNT